LSRKFAPMVLALLLCGRSPRLFAQERVEAGIFLDYLDISQTNTNNFGLGGRFGYCFHRKVMMERELAYDYGINFREAYRNITNGDITAVPCKSENLGVVSRPPLRFHPRGAQ
jgi:hypothetical protein